MGGSFHPVEGRSCVDNARRDAQQFAGVRTFALSFSPSQNVTIIVNQLAGPDELDGNGHALANG